MIKRGIYISPFAESICSDDNKEIVHGLLLDTTWRTLPHFVTSIIMASICNVGIPLGFSFGPSESKESYKVFYDKFASVINVDLKKYIIESDRGSALKAIAKEINIEHLSCSAHLLRSLKNTEFSYQVGQLVTARCQTDLNILMDIYSTEFSTFINTNKMQYLNKILMSCGLIFDTELKKIRINDEILWEHISLACRAKFKMPTTTNSLESFNGHLNSHITRRNDFYTAINRLVKLIIRKTHMFEESYKTNLSRTKRKIEAKCTHFFMQLVLKESQQYETTKEKCKCGETAIISEMMMVDIPCSHRVLKGATFPTKPDNLKLKISNSFSKFIVCLSVEGTTDDIGKDTYNKFLNRSTVATVRAFTREKNTAEI